MACAKRERMTPAVKAGYLAPYDSYANRVAILRFVQDIPMRPSHPTYRLVEEIGRGLALFKDHPMLIIWGALDWCFTADFLKEWQGQVPAAGGGLGAEGGPHVGGGADQSTTPQGGRGLSQDPAAWHP